MCTATLYIRQPNDMPVLNICYPSVRFVEQQCELEHNVAVHTQNGYNIPVALYFACTDCAFIEA